MEKKLNYEYLVKIGTIKKLPEVEKHKYIEFHDKLWKDDIKVAEKLVNENPRWSIIAGYYAMHNISKMILALKFNIKISGKYVHAAVIESLKKYFREHNLADKLKNAAMNMTLDEIPELLEIARRERSKAQYYSNRNTEISSKKAKEFLNEIVYPFIEVVKRYVL